jgi:hypothetical protein
MLGVPSIYKPIDKQRGGPIAIFDGWDSRGGCKRGVTAGGAAGSGRRRGGLGNSGVDEILRCCAPLDDGQGRVGDGVGFATALRAGTFE